MSPTKTCLPFTWLAHFASIDPVPKFSSSSAHACALHTRFCFFRISKINSPSTLTHHYLSFIPAPTSPSTLEPQSQHTALVLDCTKNSMSFFLQKSSRKQNFQHWQWCFHRSGETRWPVSLVKEKKKATSTKARTRSLNMQWFVELEPTSTSDNSLHKREAHPPDTPRNHPEKRMGNKNAPWPAQHRLSSGTKFPIRNVESHFWTSFSMIETKLIKFFLEDCPGGVSGLCVWLNSTSAKSLGTVWFKSDKSLKNPVYSWRS